MDQLEKRTYSREELAQLSGVKVDKNYKRNITSLLDKWGYEYVYAPKQVDIVRAPSTPAARLNELLIRGLSIDVRMDILAFAYFIALFSWYEDFHAMPWAERAKALKQIFNIEVSERTLYRWGKLGIDCGLLTKDGIKVYWRTNYNKTRELVSGDPEMEQEMRNYIKDKRELVKKYMAEDLDKTNLGLVRSNAYSRAFKDLWSKYGCCYYSASGIVPVAFQKGQEVSFQEIYELIEQIAATQS